MANSPKKTAPSVEKVVDDGNGFVDKVKGALTTHKKLVLVACGFVLGAVLTFCTPVHTIVKGWFHKPVPEVVLVVEAEAPTLAEANLLEDAYRVAESNAMQARDNFLVAEKQLEDAIEALTTITE